MGWRGKAMAAAVVVGFVALQWGDRLPTPGLGDQLAHVLLYYLFGLVLWRLLPPADGLARAGAVVSAGYLVAILMEVGQVHFAYRRPDEADVLADTAGLLMAVVPLAWRDPRQSAK